VADITYMSGAEQARLIKAKQLSPVELVRAYLKRIEQWDGILRAWITVDPAGALEKARTAEAEIMRGEYRGPLHGIPYGVKDQLHALGFPTTLGTRVLNEDETRAPFDAAIIERLSAAGAILLGKQNLHEFGKGGTTHFPFGQPRNPWHPSYSASSSSSGSGIAPAAGMCTFAIGQDTGGSVRGPASCNGIVGMRPTYGRVSRYGGEMHSYSADTIGPLARTVQDLATVLQGIAGYDSRDPLSSPRGVPDYHAVIGRDIRGFRLSILKESAQGSGVSSDVRESFDAAVEKLRELGADVEEISLPLVKYAVPLQLLSSDADMASWFLKKYLKDRYDRFDISTRTRLAAAILIPAVVHDRAMRARVVVRRQILDALNKCDALICPTNVTPPKPINAVNERVVKPEEIVPRLIERRISVFPFSLANVPAISVPAGFSKDGLPIGLQIAGRPFAEATILQIADCFERATSWHLQHPNLEETLVQAV
jgi:Asp-tRNA(Asn)/Glu-tRNA(Gln) amidotransferase A subunit family amidase